MSALVSEICIPLFIPKAYIISHSIVIIILNSIMSWVKQCYNSLFSVVDVCYNRFGGIRAAFFQQVSRFGKIMLQATKAHDNAKRPLIRKIVSGKIAQHLAVGKQMFV